MRPVALISPSGRGHFRAYLRIYTRTLLELGYGVTAFTPEPDDLNAWIARACPDAMSRLCAIEMNYAGRPHTNALAVFLDKVAWVHFVARVIQTAQLKPDLVFYTWLDSCLTPGLTARLTDLIFPFKWSGLYFHPWYLRQRLAHAALRRGPLTNHDALKSSRCPAVAVLDEGIADKLQAALGKKPVITFPDIADDSAPDPDFLPARQIRDRARGRTVIGLLGVLSRRKGTMLLVEAAQQMAQDQFFFVFAGDLDLASFSPEEQQTLAALTQSSPSNCFFHFQRLPDEPQFNAIVNECDILFAVYQNFPSSSNLLTKGAIFEKPLIVSNAYCMGERVHKFGIGLTIDEDSVPQCVEAIQTLRRQVEQNGRWPDARFDAYRRLHSVEQLRASFQQLLAAAFPDRGGDSERSE